MTQKQTRSAVSPAFQLNSAMLVSKERQAGSWAVALPLSTQRSGPASPPALAGCSQDGQEAHLSSQQKSAPLACILLLTRKLLPRPLRWMFQQMLLPLPSSASQPPPPLPSEWLTVQDGNHGCGTDYCAQIKKKREAPLLSYFSLPHRLSHSDSGLLYKDAVVVILSQRTHTPSRHGPWGHHRQHSHVLHSPMLPISHPT